MKSVYNTQVKTFRLAQAVAGNMSNVSDFNGSFKPPFCLRTVKAYRTPAVQAFRDEIALRMKLVRAL